MPVPEPDRHLSDLQKPLEQFRARTKRLKVHPAELRVLWVVAAHLVFLPWALGASRLWAQWPSFGLGALSLLLALLPRNYSAEHTGAEAFRLIMWPKLLRFPIFWLGGALLALVAIQAVNPAWAYRTNDKLYWLERIPHIEWLPAGTQTPFEKWNQWRLVLIYSAAWTTVCAIWIGFTRRRTLQLLITIVAANGLCLGIFGIVQRLLGNGRIYWFYESPNPSFFSSFIYKNHGAAYLFMMLALTCGLAGWYYTRGLRRLEKSNPSGVLAFAATFIAVSILTSYARGVTLVMLVFLVLVIAGFVWHQWRQPAGTRRPVVAIALVLIFGFFLKTGLEALQSREAWDRLKQGLARQDTSLEQRDEARAAALDMLEVHWKGGVGAGGFRFLFPIYQQHREKLLIPGRWLYWEHAHNDLLQFPIELGLAGVLIIVGGAGYWIVRFVRSASWENPLSMCTMMGAVAIVLYSWWDFPLQNTSILVTWSALWPIASMWATMEEQGARA